MHRHIKAWGKNGQCHWTFLEPADHGQYHVKGPRRAESLKVPPIKTNYLSAKNHATAKSETKIQESEICTSISITIFTVQLEQRCFRCLGLGRIKETGTVLCEHELVAESFYFSLFPKLGRIEFIRNAPSR